MRGVKLAVAVVIGVGAVTMRVDAQMQPPQTKAAEQLLQSAEMELLNRKLQSFQNVFKDGQGQRPGQSPAFQFQGDVDHLRVPVDCGMPVLKGDPKIDPTFSKQPPADGVNHTLRVIPVPRCPFSR